MVSLITSGMHPSPVHVRMQVMGGPVSEVQYTLFMAGANLALRVFEFPRPVVIGCSGHALALGAIFLLAADVRVGKRGPKYKIGLTEVAIGMTVPVFGVELARHSMSKAQLERGIAQAQVCVCRRSPLRPSRCNRRWKRVSS
jgi:enoyl-CoA hydratase